MRQPLRTVLIGTGATLALVAGSGIALASSGGAPQGPNTASSATVYKGCIEGSTRTLRNVYTRNPPACPSGTFRATWNEQGPPGPPGVVNGYAASGGSVSVPGTGTLTTIDTLNLPSGDFLLTAKASLYDYSLSGETYIGCDLINGSGTVDTSYTALNPGSSGGDQTTDVLMGSTAGGTIQLECASDPIAITAVDPVITAVPVASVIGGPNHQQHRPVPRGKAATVPQRG